MKFAIRLPALSLSKGSLFAASLLLSACTTNVAINPTPTPEPSPISQILPTSPSPSLTTYTLTEVAAHNTPQDCWIVIHGSVYNVSNFGDQGHPGGKAIYQGCGKDATALFESRPPENEPHSANARQSMQRFQIGVLSQ